MYSNLENLLNYKFKNIELVKLAFTHQSLINETKAKRYDSNQRLEFLGDAVIDLVIGEKLYILYPKLNEGELTKLRATIVCESTFASIALELKLYDYLKMSKGETANGSNLLPSVLADTFESIVGVIYLESGLDTLKKVVEPLFEPIIKENKKTFLKKDNKTLLQEIIQSNSKVPIEYIVVDEIGPAHSKTFFVNVIHDGRILGEGSGKSKKEASQLAAKKAIDFISN